MRVTLLIRVEPVVAPVDSWLAAHGAWCGLRALIPDAIGLVAPDPNHDHDHECGDVNHGYENDQGGQAAAHCAPLLPGVTRARDELVQLHGAIYVTSHPASARVR